MPRPHSFAPFLLAPILLAQAPTPPATVPAAIYSTRGDDRVHLVSLPDLQPLHTYDAGAGAHELAISRDGRFAIGTAYGGPGAGHQPADNRVFVLDLPAGKRHRMIDLGTSKRPNDIAFLADSATALVTTEAPPQLLRLDADAGTFTAVKLEHRANHMLALTADAATCFVSHATGGLTRFHVGTNEATHQALPVGAEGIAVVTRGDQQQVWVGCNRAGKLLVVDGKTLAVQHEFECYGFPLRVKAAPAGDRIAVSCPMSGELVFYDAAEATKTPLVIDLSQQWQGKVAPTSIAWSPDGKLLLAVVNGDTDRVVAVDAATGKVAAAIDAAGPIADALAAGLVQPTAVVR